VGGTTYKDGITEKYGPWPNDRTIGIETCHIDSFGRYAPETLQAARELCACLCEMFGLNPTDDLLRHWDYTGKMCPRWFVDHPADWVDFKQLVNQEMLAAACGDEKEGDC
jgi:N-acetylmuramoyl-L-alanine amidase CwlA